MRNHLSRYSVFKHKKKFTELIFMKLVPYVEYMLRIYCCKKIIFTKLITPIFIKFLLNNVADLRAINDYCQNSNLKHVKKNPEE